MNVKPATSEIDVSQLGAGDTSEAKSKPVRRVAQLLRLTLIGVIIAVVAIWLVLHLTKGRFLKAIFENVATSLAERRVTVNGEFELYFDPFDIHFVATGLHIANPTWAGKPDLFAAGKIEAFVAPLSMILGRHHLRSLDMTNTAIDAEWDATHLQNTWTFGAGTPGKPLTLPTIDRASVVGSNVQYQDPRLQLRANLQLGSIISHDARIGSAVQLTGSGRLRSTDFTVSGALLSPDATIARGHNQLILHARAAGNVIDVAGPSPASPMS